MSLERNTVLLTRDFYKNLLWIQKISLLCNYSLEDNKNLFFIITFIMESTLEIIIIHVREKRENFISLWTKITNSITVKHEKKGEFLQIKEVFIWSSDPRYMHTLHKHCNLTGQYWKLGKSKRKNWTCK